LQPIIDRVPDEFYAWVRATESGFLTFAGAGKGFGGRGSRRKKFKRRFPARQKKG
jgi:hypothetical protein